MDDLKLIYAVTQRLNDYLAPANYGGRSANMLMASLRHDSRHAGERRAGR